MALEKRYNFTLRDLVRSLRSLTKHASYVNQTPGAVCSNCCRFKAMHMLMFVIVRLTASSCCRTRMPQHMSIGAASSLQIRRLRMFNRLAWTPAIVCRCVDARYR